MTSLLPCIVLRRATLLLCTSALLGITAACGDSGAGGDSGGTIKLGDGGGNIEDTGLGDPDAGGVATDTGGVEADTGGTTADSGGTDDAGATTDAGPADTGPKPLDCPGGAGCECAKNDECDSGACLETPEGKVCAQTCVDSCPTGFECKNFGATDVLFVCFPKWTSLCSPCEKHNDCKVNGADARCLSYGDKGSFCGATCAADDDCPSGYTCTEEFDKDAGQSFKQCKLTDTAAECTCNKFAIKAGYATQCSKSNDLGTCKASRKCTEQGLGACEALEPAADLCDGADNDCDGTVDNLPQEVTCAVVSKLPDGSEAACPGTPVCKNGQQVCEGAVTPEAESCDAKDNDCDGKIDEDFVWTNPQTKATAAMSEPCGLGPCAGGKVICKSTTEAMCDTEKNAKAEGCDGVDDDCNGVTDDMACDDGDACTVDKCDSGASKCSNEPGADCDDKNACTADSCDKDKGECVNKPIEGSCDDGDACTEGDKCKIDGDKANCEAGAKKDCDDSNVCTDDSCDAQAGCANLAHAATEACYSGANGTEGVGACVGGVKTCKDGKLPTTCEGEVVPNVAEKCDGKDDTCDGKTDEGCKIERVHASFTSGFGKVEASSKDATHGLWYGIGGWAVGAGKPKDDKHKQADVGFIHWLLAQWK